MTETRVRIPLRDQLWLMMDRPDNLMYINSVMWFAEVPDWDAVTEAIASRMVEPHPVFRRVPVRRGRRWYWQDDPDFDISRHLVRRRLPSPGGRAEAEAHVAEQMGCNSPTTAPSGAPSSSRATTVTVATGRGRSCCSASSTGWSTGSV